MPLVLLCMLPPFKRPLISRRYCFCHLAVIVRFEHTADDVSPDHPVNRYPSLVGSAGKVMLFPSETVEVVIVPP